MFMCQKRPDCHGVLKKISELNRTLMLNKQTNFQIVMKFDEFSWLFWTYDQHKLKIRKM